MRGPWRLHSRGEMLVSICKNEDGVIGEKHSWQGHVRGLQKAQHNGDQGEGSHGDRSKLIDGWATMRRMELGSDGEGSLEYCSKI